MAKSKFPKTIYVKEEGQDNDKYLAIHDDVKSAAEISEEVEVGIYQFVRLAKIKTSVEVL